MSRESGPAGGKQASAIEAVAVALWQEELGSSAPRVRAQRTPKTFGNELPQVQEKFRRYALAALRAASAGGTVEPLGVEAVVNIIKENLSGPMFQEPEIQAAHEKDLVETARLILAALSQPAQGGEG